MDNIEITTCRVHEHEGIENGNSSDSQHSPLHTQENEIVYPTRPKNDDTSNDSSTTTHALRMDATTAGVSRNKRRRRVIRNYLSMIGIAFALTVSCPGSSLWVPSTAENSSTNIHNSSLQNQLHRSSTQSLEEMPEDENSSETLTFLDQEEYDVQNFTSRAPQSSTQTKYNLGHLNSSLYGSLNILIFVKLASLIFMLVLSFFNVRGSTPGCLTADVMRRLDDVESDGRKKPVFGNENSVHTSDDTDTTNEGYFDGNDDLGMERENFLPINHHNEHDERSRLSADSEPSIKSNLNNNSDPKLYPHTRRKYCNTCQIHPPLRSHHCQTCNQCIATFDHHCVFLDTCIGERNHFRFWFFLLLNVVNLKVALDIANSGHVTSHAHEDEEVSRNWLEIFVYAILIISKLYMYPIFVIASLLWVIHTVLAVGNSTTFECSKGGKHIDYLRGTAMMDFPFTRGLFGNIGIFFSRDDAFRWISKQGKKIEYDCILTRSLQRMMWRRYCCCRMSKGKEQNPDTGSRKEWLPILWKMPRYIVRDSEDWWNHPWQNKYWSCC